MRSARVLALVVLLSLGASAAASTYTVRWGDTLTRIAKRVGVPLGALAASNRLDDPDHIREGQVLSVPDRDAAGVAVAQPIAAVGPGARAYRVRKGDTLTAIARRFDTSVRALREANGIDGDRIRHGDTLRVPASANLPPPLCPVAGATKFDFSNSFGAPREGRRHHKGNDIFAGRGTHVVAPISGELRRVTGTITGIGFYLHGDDGVTYYGAHLDELRAGPGRVERGAVIGTVGSSGNARGTPPHLHFELKPGGGAPVDPYPYLRAWCR